ncbi:hypothetical protein Tco_0475883, partial [Tanacetum coccineum]
VLAISVISISLDSSDESVGSSTCRIILFGTIPAEIPTETHVIPPAAPDRVAASSSPPSSPTHDFPPAVCQLVLAPSDVPRRPAILVIPDSSSDYSSGHSFQDSSFLSEDSPFDAPTTISVGPSRKRCRSPAALVPLATTALGALSPVRADLLPPCKRIRGSVIASDYDDSTEGSYEAYTDPDIDFDVQVDIDVDTADAKTAVALEVGIEIETNVVGVEVGIRIEREDEVEEEAEPGGRGTIEIRVDRVSNIKSAQREHGRRMLVASEQRAGMLDRIRVLERDNMRLREMLTMPTTTRSRMTPAAIEEMIERRVVEALEAYEANRNRRPTMESGDEHKDDNGDDNGNGNGNGGGNGNGNGLGGGNGNGNPNMNVGGLMPVACECTYQGFLKCQPLIFKGTEGVNSALTWWNSHKRTVGTDVAYAMS